MQFFLAQAEEESSGGLIDVVPGLMIWTLICFGITFYVLKRFAFARIQAGIDERRERIRKAVEEADRARDEARSLLEEHRQLIGQAKSEAAGILAEARKVGDAQIERVKQEAEEERQRRLEETKRQIEAETKRSLDTIRGEVAELTLAATARVTGKVLDAEDQRRLIDEAISELDFSALERENAEWPSPSACTRARSSRRHATKAGSKPPRPTWPRSRVRSRRSPSCARC